MKSFTTGLLIFCSAAATSLADDKTSFSKIWDSGFDTYQQAEDALSRDNKQDAIAKFRAALDKFNKISSGTLTPWQKKIIKYRIDLCKTNINAIAHALNTGTKVKLAGAEPQINPDSTAGVSEIEALKKQRKSLEDTLKIYIDKYNQEITTTENLRKDLIDLTKELQKYKAQNSVLNQQLDEQNKQLQDEIAKCAKNISDKEKSYQKRIETLKATIEELKTEKASIKEYVDSKEVEFDKLNKKLELQNIEINSLKDEVASRKKNIAELQDRLQELEATLAATKETTAKTNEYVASQKQYITKLNTDNAALETKLKNVTKQLADTSDKLKKLAKENFNLKIFMQEKINEKNELTAKVKDLEELVKFEKKNSETAKSKLQELMAASGAASQELADKNSTIAKLQDALKIKESAIDTLKNQYKSLQTQFASVKEQLIQKDNFSNNQANYINELKNQLTAKNTELSENKTLIANTQKKIDELQKNELKLQEQLQAKDTEISELNDKLAKQKTINAGLQEQIAVMKEAVNDKGKASELALKEIESLKTESKLKTDKINELKTELAKVRMQLSTKNVDIAILNEQIVTLQNKLNTTAGQSLTGSVIKSVHRPALPFTGVGRETSITGRLYRVKAKSSYITHALVNPKTRKALSYVHFNEDAKKYEGRVIKIDGLLRNVKNWRTPVIDAVIITTVR